MKTKVGLVFSEQENNIGFETRILVESLMNSLTEEQAYQFSTLSTSTILEEMIKDTVQSNGGELNQLSRVGDYSHFYSENDAFLFLAGDQDIFKPLMQLTIFNRKNRNPKPIIIYNEDGSYTNLLLGQTKNNGRPVEWTTKDYSVKIGEVGVKSLLPTKIQKKERIR